MSKLPNLDADKEITNDGVWLEHPRLHERHDVAAVPRVGRVGGDFDRAVGVHHRDRGRRQPQLRERAVDHVADNVAHVIGVVEVIVVHVNDGLPSRELDRDVAEVAQGWVRCPDARRTARGS